MFSYDKELGGLKPSVGLVDGHLQVAGTMTDGVPMNNPEPYLLVEGVCPVGNHNGVMELKHDEEKYVLPSNFPCNENVREVRRIVILLDGVSESPICSREHGFGTLKKYVVE